MRKVGLARARAASILAALQLLSGLALATNLVFCRDATGEFAVEIAGTCCPSGLGSPAFVLDESCGCSDTPLFQNVAEGFSTFRLETAPPTLYLLSDVPPQSLMPLVSLRVSGRLPTFPPDVQLHRSVVLLL